MNNITLLVNIERADDEALFSLVPTQFLPFSTNIFHDKSFGALFPFYSDIKFCFLYNQCHLLSFPHYTASFFMGSITGLRGQTISYEDRVLELDCLDKILNYSQKIILHP